MQMIVAFLYCSRQLIYFMKIYLNFFHRKKNGLNGCGFCCCYQYLRRNAIELPSTTRYTSDEPDVNIFHVWIYYRPFGSALTIIAFRLFRSFFLFHFSFDRLGVAANVAAAYRFRPLEIEHRHRSTTGRIYLFMVVKVDTVECMLCVCVCVLPAPQTLKIENNWLFSIVSSNLFRVWTVCVWDIDFVFVLCFFLHFISRFFSLYYFVTKQSIFSWERGRIKYE